MRKAICWDEIRGAEVKTFRVNRYPGRCSRCDGWVATGQGRLGAEYALLHRDEDSCRAHAQARAQEDPWLYSEEFGDH